MSKRRSNPYKKPDRFTRDAKEAGFAARSVFKLQEIQRRFPILKRGMRVVDLGCCPGSWWAYAAQTVGRQGVAVGLDIEEPPKKFGPFFAASILDTPPQALRDALGGPADVVLSDIAPRTTGDTFGDHVRQIELAQGAHRMARELLVVGGSFVCKVFDGEDAHGFVMDVRSDFDKVKRLRPQAVRKQSREFFVLGLGRKA